MTEVCRTSLSTFACRAPPPPPYKGVGWGNLGALLPHLAAPHLVEVGQKVREPRLGEGQPIS